ncbi:Type I phosphodiesterase / nucleotide pyrophosphatase [Arenibacter nanhaiticus]|uniref:Type I phosphodiesterase / nucleotide pyrophosphatase n=1 Tax=Arenibacter nanhaiticus TaxID=558155 RepID=A0A1M6IT87_9FLAO|nr:alkaline phosphatase [Arenibacter nanhaiticus]SHJ37617.1 Type I phosphodiesterase / nucleotide pyrophosphatase [Arenibacter nanhaiticus]
MRHFVKILGISIVGILFLNSCKSSQFSGTHKPIAKRVILIGSDGFGAYAFSKAKVPNLRKLMMEGAYSLEARSVLPSSSAVNWASMIMGSGPELHGYTEWGSKTPELPSRIIGEGNIYPTIFSVLDEQRPKAKKGVSYTWGGIGYLFEKNMVDLDFNGKTDKETVAKAMKFVVKEKPVFTFIHLTHPDNEGHEVGHGTPEYYKAVEGVDALVGDIVATLEKKGMLEDTILIFSSDHGGIDKGHGGKTLAEVEIPWIIYGKGIPAKGKLASSIVTYDTAATIAYALGLQMPDFWRGKPVKEVFIDEK